MPVKNPHQQILAVGIELGLVGISVLIAMWVAHLSLFRYDGELAWSGMVAVTMHVVSSMFNSHLIDFAQGWFYVFTVGVLGGAVLHLRSTDKMGCVSERRTMPSIQ